MIGRLIGIAALSVFVALELVADLQSSNAAGTTADICMLIVCLAVAAAITLDCRVIMLQGDMIGSLKAMIRNTQLANMRHDDEDRADIHR